MLKRVIFLFAVLLVFSSHDMFLKMHSYQLESNASSTILLYNGTFDRSDNIITRDRMLDVSLVGNGERSQVDTSAWMDEDKTTILNFTTGAAGTWVAGVSTKARNIELEAKKFNDYLDHDGVLDVLEDRKKNNLLDEDAIEKYSKHVKTIFQVGGVKTEDWKTALGYPIEFVPLQNPYETVVNDELEVQLLWQGNPLTNQLVYTAAAAHSHAHDDHAHDSGEDHHHHDATALRTDENGVAKIKINAPGEWYVRTIHMEKSTEPGLTHESNWATLTFAIPGEEKIPEGYHVHEDGTVHSHGPGLPWMKYGGIGLVGMLIIIGIVWFSKRK